MVEFVFKIGLKFTIFSIIISLISKVILNVAIPFFEVLTNGTIRTVLTSIDYFLPLPFLCGCLFWILSMRYFDVFWSFYKWIYDMIFK